MSLDVSLSGNTKFVECICSRCDNSHRRKETEEFFSANITHNLSDMAREAGIYYSLWRPEEIGIIKASQLIDTLRAGLSILKSDPKRFEKFNSPNGWGLYENFVPFVESYLAACEEHPTADVSVSR